MASVQAAPAMPPNLPTLPGNLTQQQVAEVYEVRITSYTGTFATQFNVFPNQTSVFLY